MRLLITTQIVDQEDPILGFFHAWIREFAKRCESVEVICLKAGSFDLPSNVTVHSLGKEKGYSRFTYLWRFYRAIWVARRRYDAVFVHMNPEYVILGGLLWRLWGKTIGLWYAHGTVTMKLRVATALCHIVLSSTPQGFRLPSQKVRIVGQGIDTARFAWNPHAPKVPLSLGSVGRISRSKNLITAISALAIIRDVMPATLTLYGVTMTDDDAAYRAELEAFVRDRGLAEAVTFAGGVAQHELPRALASLDAFVSDGGTGSLDKALLEPLAVGIPTISSNGAFRAMLPATRRDMLTFSPRDHEALAARILALQTRADREEVAKELRALVESQHGMEGLIDRILAAYAKG